MARSNITAEFNCDSKTIWEIITNNEDWKWRSDLSKIEVLSEKQFVEYTKDGFPTTFTITKKEPCKRYEFDMENKNMSGHWTGILTETSNGVSIDFTEDVTVKNPIMKLFVKGFLKKQQNLYISDLQAKLAGL